MWSAWEWPLVRKKTLYNNAVHLPFTPAPPALQKWNVSQMKIRVFSTVLFILFGCVIFVALPAVIFKHIEGWSALESIYFVVITLTTIGFGDFVAGEKGSLIHPPPSC